MHVILFFLLFIFVSLITLADEGTLTTDPTDVSHAPASLSGYEKQDVSRHSSDDEFQMEEEDTSYDERKKTYETELDEEEMDRD